MAEDERTMQDNRIRKLRKKLRQIEILQRLCGCRELTEEEAAKVSQRDIVREQLQDLLTLVLDEQESNRVEESNAEEGQTSSQDQDDQSSEGNCKMEQESTQEEETADDVEPVDVDCSDQQKEVKKLDENTQSKDEVATLVRNNETDDKKVEKILKGDKKKKVASGVKEWKNMTFSVKAIEGHHHPVCAVDSNEDTFISAGHDTSLKVWNSSTSEEVFSLGGHTGSISSAYLVSDDKAVTGSQDCSIKIWDISKGALLSSVYVYSPVTCLALSKNKLAIGNEGGKIDIYGLETGQVAFSIKAHDEAVVCLEFMDGDKLASASEDGIIKIFEISDDKYVEILDSYNDITGVSPLNKDDNKADTPNTSLANLPLRKINCLATFKNYIFWGDDGYNIKAMETNTGHILKLRNNLSEFSPTDALAVLSNGDSGWLFCAGYDIDNGHGYINVRSLPSMEYVGTISDSTLGHVNCIAPSWHDGKIRILTAGSEFRIWEQQVKVNSKKRPASDAIDDVIPCKFICSYNSVQDSENESESSDTEEEADMSVDEKPESQSKSWCVLQ